MDGDRVFLRKSLKPSYQGYKHDPEAVFRFIVDFKIQNGGDSPSLREIQMKFGISSSSVVQYILNYLEQQGRIYRPRHHARFIFVPILEIRENPEALAIRQREPNAGST